MDFQDRLKIFIKATGLKKDDFFQKTGKSRGMLFKYLKGENYPSGDFFQMLKKEWPWLNVEWLITGIGDMEAPVINEEQTDYTRDSPLIDDVAAKILLILKDMPADKRRDVLRYAEEKKQLADLLAESGGSEMSKRKKSSGGT